MRLIVKNNRLVIVRNSLLTSEGGALCCCGTTGGPCTGACTTAIIPENCGGDGSGTGPGFCCECGERFRIRLTIDSRSSSVYTRDHTIMDGGVFVRAGPLRDRSIVGSVTVEWACVDRGGRGIVVKVAQEGLIVVTATTHTSGQPPTTSTIEMTTHDLLCRSVVASVYNYVTQGWLGGSILPITFPPCDGFLSIPQFHRGNQLPEPSTAQWQSGQGCNARFFTGQYRIPLHGLVGGQYAVVGQDAGTAYAAMTIERLVPCVSPPCINPPVIVEVPPPPTPGPPPPPPPPGPPPPPAPGNEPRGCCVTTTGQRLVTTAADCFARGAFQFSQGVDCAGRALATSVPSLRRLGELV